MPTNKTYDASIHELAKEYGFKTANLIFLKETLELQVPHFEGIKDSFIYNFINKQGNDFENLWNNFIQSQPKEEKVITQNAQNNLNNIQNYIKKLFNEKTIEISFTKELLSSKRIILRSTGNEDREDLSNPGGNESIVCENNINSIQIAIGEVVSSYFSIKSMSQRLSSGEDITSSRPKMACLAQVLVCENRNDDKRIHPDINNLPPVSGAIYTDGFGNINIQAAPGSGEYVVNSIGPSDSIFVSKEDIVYRAIANKQFRLTPKFNEEKSRLELVKESNPSAIALTASLNNRVSKNLANIARDIEKAYGMPMDIEFVYNPNTKNISIVQARALQKNSINLNNPNAVTKQFLISSKKDKDFISLKGDVITSDILFTATIEKPNQLLVFDTIDQALRAWFNDPINVKSVIVKEDSPSTSHESGMFTSKGIPVLRFDNLNDVNKIINDTEFDNYSLVIDPQNNSLFRISKKELQKDADENPIQKGIFKSTLTDQVTLFDYKKKPAFLTKSPVKQDSHYNNLEEIKKDLDNISNLPVNDHQKIVILNSINKIIAFLQSKAEAQVIPENLFYNLIYTAGHLISKINSLSQKEMSPQETKEYLDVFKKFEGLIISEKKDNFISTSVIRELRKVYASRKRQAIADIDISKLDSDSLDYFNELIKLSDEIVVKNRRKNWIEFCYHICAQKKGHVLGCLMSKLVKENIHSYWMNLIFSRVYADKVNNNQEEINVLTELLQNESDSKESFNNLQKASNIISAIENDIPKFSISSEFNSMFDKLNLRIKQVDDILFKLSDSKDDLVLFYLSKLTHRMTDAFDKSIKSLQVSTDYSQKDEQHVSNFKSMIEMFFELLKRRAPHYNFVKKDKLDRVDYKLKQIDRGLKNLSTEKNQLDVTAGLEVEHSNVFSEYEFSNVESLANIHSTIHQSLMTFSSNLLKKFMSMESLNSFLAASHLELHKTLPINLEVVDISFKNGNSVILYNCQLRDHSIAFRTKYNSVSNEIFVDLMFYGSGNSSEVERWYYISHLFISLFSKLNYEILKCKADIKSFHGSLSFVPTESNFKELKSNIRRIQDKTYSFDRVPHKDIEDLKISESLRQHMIKGENEIYLDENAKKYLLSKIEKDKIINAINNSQISNTEKLKLQSSYNALLLIKNGFKIEEVSNFSDDIITIFSRSDFSIIHKYPFIKEAILKHSNDNFQSNYKAVLEYNFNIDEIYRMKNFNIIDDPSIIKIIQLKALVFSSSLKFFNNDTERYFSLPFWKNLKEIFPDVINRIESDVYSASVESSVSQSLN